MITPLLAAMAFFSGIFLRIFSDFGLSSWFVAFGGVILFIRPKTAVLIIAVLLGIWRVGSFEEQIPLGIPIGTYVTLEGEIIEEIDRRIDVQKITVMTEHGRVLASVSPYVELSYGDLVKISGDLQEPSDDIEGFNYKKYLERYRVWSVIYDAKVYQQQRAPPSVRGFLYEFKAKTEKRLNRLFFEPEASFAAGLLLGSRKGMPEDLAKAFQKVGLTHIVAISGYNISLVIALMFLMLSFLPLKVRVIVSTIAIVLFVILVGASAAVVRAGIMGSLTLWGLFTGRKSQAFFALLWSAVLMVIMNPYTLVYDAGYEFSPLVWMWSKFLSIFWRSKAKLKYGNFWTKDFSDADVIVCYLLPGAMKKMKDKIFPQLKPGAYIVSHAFHLPGYEPLKKLPRLKAERIGSIWVYKKS